MKKIISLVLITISLACSNIENNTCDLEDIRTLYSDIVTHGEDTSYVYYLLLNQFPKRCLDSIDISSLIKTYIDTISNEKERRNIDVIQVYNSDKYFEIDGPASNWSESHKAFLFAVLLDKKSKEIKSVKFNSWESF